MKTIHLIFFLLFFVEKSISSPSHISPTTTARTVVDKNEAKIREEFRHMQLESWIKNRGLPDGKAGLNVDKWNASTSKDNPEERGVYLEGDILFEVDPASPKSALIGDNYRWPNGEVYVKFSPVFNPSELALLKNAIKYIEMHTCIRFYYYQPGVRDYIDITSSHTGCYSNVGRIGGPQRLNLQRPGCMNLRTATHEMIHALGFFHEQSRTDRDRYIQINYGNIVPHEIHNFNKNDNSNHQGIPYDFLSIMHYSRYAFARNPRIPTINFKPPYQDYEKLSSNDNKLSWNDVKKINRLYKCEASGEN
ncbi:astacin-like [Neocloeon triangulifer]|uniref:astacin-like n=1 Tax=Neocloeon triangulifer TaxID=2078957 RepID=UPI00286F5C03|nr:astacin-like [Neocloeon triangulifer]